MEFVQGQLAAYCSMVKNGKPAALLSIKSCHVESALALIQTYDLHSYVENLSDERKSLWIYKFPHVLEVIKSTKQAPVTNVDHWMLGKLFGYDEQSINDFLEKA
jgi:hypothetical protein